VAVAANAASGLARHARAGKVRWAYAAVIAAAVIAAAGVAGAFAGSAVGRRIDGQALLAAFAVLTMVLATLRVRRHDPGEDQVMRLHCGNAPVLAAEGLAVGAPSGSFGIGGGFLIVPGLVFGTGLPMLQAIGSSLVAVTDFGLTTAGTYAAAGLVDRRLAWLFVAGGARGARAAHGPSQRRGALTRVFSGLILVVAATMIARSLGSA